MSCRLFGIACAEPLNLNVILAQLMTIDLRVL